MVGDGFRRCRKGDCTSDSGWNKSKEKRRRDHGSSPKVKSFILSVAFTQMLSYPFPSNGDELVKLYIAQQDLERSLAQVKATMIHSPVLISACFHSVHRITKSKMSVA